VVASGSTSQIVHLSRRYIWTNLQNENRCGRVSGSSPALSRNSSAQHLVVLVGVKEIDERLESEVEPGSQVLKVLIMN